MAGLGGPAGPGWVDIGSSSWRSFVLHPATRSEKATDMHHSDHRVPFKLKADIGQTGSPSVFLLFTKACDSVLNKVLPRYRLALSHNSHRRHSDWVRLRSSKYGVRGPYDRSVLLVTTLNRTGRAM